MTMGAVGSMVGATLIGPVKENFSWEWTFLSFSLMLMLAGIVMHFLNIDKQIEQISELENRKVGNQALIMNDFL